MPLDKNWRIAFGNFNTDISGYVPDRLLQEHMQRIQRVFTGKVPGFYDSKKVEYDVCVNLYKSVVSIGEELHAGEKWRDIVRPEFQNEYEKRWRGWSPCRRVLLVNDWALVFPHHNSALIIDSHALTRRFEEGLQKMEELGYAPIQRNEHNDSLYDWTRENKIDFLRGLRDPALPTKAFDSRAADIVQTLVAHLPRDIEVYTLGVFAPGINRTVVRPDEYTPHIKERKINPVKELHEIPVQFLPLSLERLSKGLPLTRAVGLTSRVQTQKGTMHIPMIDFAREVFDLGDERLGEIGMDGMIVDSGNAGHFYGFELLEESDWKAFVERVKEIDYVDEHWAELQLKQGYSMLRLTPCENRLYQPVFSRLYKPKRVEGDTDSVVQIPRSRYALAA